MTRQRYTGEAFDQLVESWLDDRSHGPAADDVLRRALDRTSRARPLPALARSRTMAARGTDRTGTARHAAGAGPDAHRSAAACRRGSDRRDRLPAAPPTALRTRRAGGRGIRRRRPHLDGEPRRLRPFAK